MIEYIQSILLLISAFLIIVSAIGLISLGKDVKNVVYGRIHIVGVFDIACIIAMIALGQFLLAAIYFILAPFTAHAIANAYWKNEDRENNLDLVTVEKVDDDNPFLHPRSKIQTLESEDSVKLKTDEKFSVTMLEIDEGE
ncbi:MAG: cation:proton antiporter [Methanobrevibacter sp.]|nr:cation:proton antiporter [Methanobrevibacter sp.]